MHFSGLFRPFRSRARSRAFGLLPAFLLAATLSGCYTQLATRGYGAPDAPAYGQGGGGQAPAPEDSAARAAYDSALAARASDSAPSAGAPAVIVHNYYDVGPSYRGYAHWAWDHPSLYIGYYSSGYSRYARPWWWDDPYYSHRYHGHRHRHHHHHGHGRPWSGSGGGSSSSGGDVTGGGRLHNPETTYPAVRKGRRAPDPDPAPAAAPAPAPAPVPTPKQGDAGSSSSSSGSSSSGESSGSASPDESSRDDSGYRSLKKGKRR